MDTDETKDPLEILRLAQEDRRAEPAPTETGERRDWRDLLTGALLALILIAGATGVAWQFYGERLRRPEWVERLLPGKAHPAGTAALRDVYYCPMHKDYQSDKPGNCPICSMQLVKKEKSAMAAESPAPAGASGRPNTIFVAPQQQQLTGVRTEPAGYRHLAKEIRAAGKIAYDETRVTHIHTKVSGWIEHVFVDFSRVWALGEIYEYELPLVKTGEKTEIEMPYEQGAPPLRGTVNYVYPYLNPATRTGQIRMEFPNPSYALKPDMFVNVKLRINLGRQLTVPEDAVFDTGTE